MAKFTYGTRATCHLNISTLLQMVKNKGNNHPLATDSNLFGGMDNNFGGVALKDPITHKDHAVIRILHGGRLCIRQIANSISRCLLSKFSQVNSNLSGQFSWLRQGITQIITDFTSIKFISEWYCRSLKKNWQPDKFFLKTHHHSIPHGQSHLWLLFKSSYNSCGYSNFMGQTSLTQLRRMAANSRRSHSIGFGSEIYGFSNASQQATATVHHGITTFLTIGLSFIFSSRRKATINSCSISRLEFRAARSTQRACLDNLQLPSSHVHFLDR